MRPGDNSFIENHIDRPYEIHLVEFATEQDFENFKQDEERKIFFKGQNYCKLPPWKIPHYYA